ncbi:SIS domain-containing protein [Thermus sp.]|uniref:SIS domain-containing protein n=1 Tax=Thermus sp. TaxID=275 RepID=UPI0025F29333|nr:SIS domain-containing protein [Thermus sp.]MCS6868321.1 SIS domain-containing protein [Thermus sp.]MCX7850034.1 SIS domain-containing protein [Thermus sp.]MDW8356377.1 SIS domain-containing protein [Thermus sp.]
MASLLRQETEEAPKVVERLLKENEAEVRSLAAFLRRRPPALVLTAARGSSDFAALYAKYLLEARLFWPVLSLAPSVLTLYRARPKVPYPSLLLAYSQSGESPDVVEAVAAYRAQGVLTLALVNREGSPLAQAAEVVLPLHAGEERSVAASKSFLAMLAATAHLLAHLLEEPRLRHALPALPEALFRALEGEGELAYLEDAEGLFILGRGFAYPVALEAALKLKEVAALQAEGYSAAEFLHGPQALLQQGFPVLALVQGDETLEATLKTLEALRAKGAHLLVLSPVLEALDLAHTPLPVPAASEPELTPLLLAQAFYPKAEALARARGLDPDRPRHLSKVTRTR